jgi:hypothetical protein
MQIFKDLSTLIWGILNRHPNWQGTRLKVYGPIVIEKHEGIKRTWMITFCCPRLWVLTPYELESAHLESRCRLGKADKPAVDE